MPEAYDAQMVLAAIIGGIPLNLEYRFPTPRVRELAEQHRVLGALFQEAHAELMRELRGMVSDTYWDAVTGKYT